MFIFLRFSLFLALSACAASSPGLDTFETKANQGDVKAAASLAHAYYWGQGVPKNYGTAVKWWRIAAEKGDAQAMASLGDMNTKGLGTPKNESRGADWYRRGAEAGNAVAQYRLGNSYATGLGVPQDLQRAYMWLIIALDGNLKPVDRRHAFRERDRIATGLKLSQRNQSEQRAKAWRAGRR